MSLPKPTKKPCCPCPCTKDHVTNLVLDLPTQGGDANAIPGTTPEQIPLGGPRGRAARREPAPGLLLPSFESGGLVSSRLSGVPIAPAAAPQGPGASVGPAVQGVGLSDLEATRQSLGGVAAPASGGAPIDRPGSSEPEYWARQFRDTSQAVTIPGGGSPGGGGAARGDVHGGRVGGGFISGILSPSGGLQRNQDAVAGPNAWGMQAIDPDLATPQGVDPGVAQRVREFETRMRAGSDLSGDPNKPVGHDQAVAALQQAGRPGGATTEATRSAAEKQRQENEARFAEAGFTRADREGPGAGDPPEIEVGWRQASPLDREQALKDWTKQHFDKGVLAELDRAPQRVRDLRDRDVDVPAAGPRDAGAGARESSPMGGGGLSPEPIDARPRAPAGVPFGPRPGLSPEPIGRGVHGSLTPQPVPPPPVPTDPTQPTQGRAPLAIAPPRDPFRANAPVPTDPTDPHANREAFQPTIGDTDAPTGVLTPEQTSSVGLTGLHGSWSGTGNGDSEGLADAPRGESPGGASSPKGPARPPAHQQPPQNAVPTSLPAGAGVHSAEMNSLTDLGGVGNLEVNDHAVLQAAANGTLAPSFGGATQDERAAHETRQLREDPFIVALRRVLGGPGGRGKRNPPPPPRRDPSDPPDLPPPLDGSGPNDLDLSDCVCCCEGAGSGASAVAAAGDEAGPPTLETWSALATTPSDDRIHAAGDEPPPSHAIDIIKDEVPTRWRRSIRVPGSHFEATLGDGPQHESEGTSKLLFGSFRYGKEARKIELDIRRTIRRHKRLGPRPEVGEEEDPEKARRRKEIADRLDLLLRQLAFNDALEKIADDLGLEVPKELEDALWNDPEVQQKLSERISATFRIAMLRKWHTKLTLGQFTTPPFPKNLTSDQKLAIQMQVSLEISGVKNSRDGIDAEIEAIAIEYVSGGILDTIRSRTTRKRAISAWFSVMPQRWEGRVKAILAEAHRIDRVDAAQYGPLDVAVHVEGRNDYGVPVPNPISHFYDRWKLSILANQRVTSYLDQLAKTTGAEFDKDSVGRGVGFGRSGVVVNLNNGHVMSPASAGSTGQAVDEALSSFLAMLWFVSKRPPVRGPAVQFLHDNPNLPVAEYLGPRGGADFQHGWLRYTDENGEYIEAGAAKPIEAESRTTPVLVPPLYVPPIGWLPPTVWDFPVAEVGDHRDADERRWLNPGASGEFAADVDAERAKNLMVVGEPLGLYIPWCQDCNDYVRGVLNASRLGPDDDRGIWERGYWPGVHHLAAPPSTYRGVVGTVFLADPEHIDSLEEVMDSYLAEDR